MSQSILYVCEYQAHKLCDSFMYIFLCLSEMVCVHLCVPPIPAGTCMRDTCMNPDVEFKIVFYEIFIMLGIKFIIKTELFTRL